MRINRVAAKAALMTVGLATASLTFVAPAQAKVFEAGAAHCVEDSHSAAARGGPSKVGDHRDISRAEQARIERQTRQILDRKGKPGGGGGGGTGGPKGDVPVYVHVMAASNGAGDVSDSQINAQIAVLNDNFGGSDQDGNGLDTGVGFHLVDIDRHYNDSWHKDRQSSQYRSATREGGKNALNIWLVDFDYLGIATFPWDYARNGSIDGVRVHWDSVPGGSIANYDQGETATHEVGHWLGLYHTFQGGCTATNDEVGDTPAQSSPSSGCPTNRDSCSLPGLDPIHNYMDYSYDSCYFTFSPGQSARVDQMWTAYRL